MTNNLTAQQMLIALGEQGLTSYQITRDLPAETPISERCLDRWKTGERNASTTYLNILRAYHAKKMKALL